MRFTGFSFGSIRVDGVTYDHDLVIDRGKIRKRKKACGVPEVCLACELQR